MLVDDNNKHLISLLLHAGSPLLPDHQEANGPVCDQSQAQ